MANNINFLSRRVTPTTADIKKCGKGNWRLAGHTNNVLRFSTNGNDFFELHEKNSPITLYNTELYLDTSSYGYVNQVPQTIIPRYTRQNEQKSQNTDEKITSQASIVDDYYEGIL
tara:strand:+ start:122 stop:466 length:345 start_codon:yes stop_codon:yes gene_type:complete